MTAAGSQRAISITQKIASRMIEAESLCVKVRNLLNTNGLGHVCFPVELLARECLTNALLHGNESDVEKSIWLTLKVGREWIRLTVCDEGPGFNWQKARHSDSDRNASHGRGLQLYALYADRVQFNRCGNKITLWIGKEHRTRKDNGKMTDYVFEQKDQQGSVTLAGDLTAILVPELQAGLKEMLNKGARDVVFDLAKTAMLDSSGMGLLIATANSLAHNGGKLRVTNVCPDIFRLLQSMRLAARLNVSARAD